MPINDSFLSSPYMSFNKRLRDLVNGGLSWQEAQSRLAREHGIEPNYEAVKGISPLEADAGDTISVDINDQEQVEYPIVYNDDGNPRVLNGDKETTILNFMTDHMGKNNLTFKRHQYVDDLKQRLQPRLEDVMENVTPAGMGAPVDDSVLTWPMDYILHARDSEDYGTFLQRNGVDVPNYVSPEKISEDVMREGYALDRELTTNPLSWGENLAQFGKQAVKELGARISNTFNGIPDEREETLKRFWEAVPGEEFSSTIHNLEKGSLVGHLAAGALRAIGVREPFKEFEPTTPMEQMVGTVGELAGWMAGWLPVSWAAKAGLVKKAIPKVLPGLMPKLEGAFARTIEKRIAKNTSPFMKLLFNDANLTFKAAGKGGGVLFGWGPKLATKEMTAGVATQAAKAAEFATTTFTAGQLYEHLIETFDTLTGGEYNPAQASLFGLTYMLDVPFARMQSLRAVAKAKDVGAYKKDLASLIRKNIKGPEYEGLTGFGELADRIESMSTQQFLDTHKPILEHLRKNMEFIARKDGLSARLQEVKNMQTTLNRTLTTAKNADEINKAVDFETFLPDKVANHVEEALAEINLAPIGGATDRNLESLRTLDLKITDLQAKFKEGGHEFYNKGSALYTTIQTAKSSHAVPAHTNELMRRMLNDPFSVFADPDGQMALWQKSLEGHSGPSIIDEFGKVAQEAIPSPEAVGAVNFLDKTLNERFGRGEVSTLEWDALKSHKTPEAEKPISEKIGVPKQASTELPGQLSLNFAYPESFNGRAAIALDNIRPDNKKGSLGILLNNLKDAGEAPSDELISIMKQVKETFSLGVEGIRPEETANKLIEAMPDKSAGELLTTLEGLHSRVNEILVGRQKEDWSGAAKNLLKGIPDDALAEMKKDGRLHAATNYVEFVQDLKQNFDGYREGILDSLEKLMPVDDAAKIVEKMEGILKRNPEASLDDVLEVYRDFIGRSADTLVGATMRSRYLKFKGVTEPELHDSNAIQKIIESHYDMLQKGIKVVPPTHDLTLDQHVEQALFRVAANPEKSLDNAEHVRLAIKNAIELGASGKTKLEAEKGWIASKGGTDKAIESYMRKVLKGEIGPKDHRTSIPFSPTHMTRNGQGQVWMLHQLVENKKSGSFDILSVDMDMAGNMIKTEAGVIPGNRRITNQKTVQTMFDNGQLEPIQGVKQGGPGVSKSHAPNKEDYAVSKDFSDNVDKKPPKKRASAKKSKQGDLNVVQRDVEVFRIKSSGKKIESKPVKIDYQETPVEVVQFDLVNNHNTRIYLEYKYLRDAVKAIQTHGEGMKNAAYEALQKLNRDKVTGEFIGVNEINKIAKSVEESPEYVFNQLRDLGTIDRIVLRDVGGEKAIGYLPYTEELRKGMIHGEGAITEHVRMTEYNKDKSPDLFAMPEASFISEPYHALYETGTMPSPAEVNDWFVRILNDQSVSLNTETLTRVMGESAAKNKPIVFTQKLAKWLHAETSKYNPKILTAEGRELQDLIRSEVHRVEFMANLSPEERQMRRRLLAMLPFARALTKSTIVDGGKRVAYNKWINAALGLTTVPYALHFLAPEALHAAGAIGGDDVDITYDDGGYGWGLLAAVGGVAFALRYGSGRKIGKRMGKHLLNKVKDIERAVKDGKRLVSIDELSKEQAQSVKFLDETLRFHQDIFDLDFKFGDAHHTQTPEWQQFTKAYAELHAIDPANMDIREVFRTFGNISRNYAAHTGKPFRFAAGDMGHYVANIMTPWMVAKVHPEVMPYVYAAMARSTTEHRWLGQMFADIPTVFSVAHHKYGFSKDELRTLDSAIYDIVHGNKWDDATKDAVRKRFTEEPTIVAGANEKAETAVKAIDEMINTMNTRVEALKRNRMSPDARERYEARYNKRDGKIYFPEDRGRGDYIMFMYSDPEVGAATVQLGSPRKEDGLLYWRKFKSKKEADSFADQALREAKATWAAKGTELGDNNAKILASKTANDFITVRAQVGGDTIRHDYETMAATLIQTAEDLAKRADVQAEGMKSSHNKTTWRKKSQQFAGAAEKIRTLEGDPIVAQVMRAAEGRGFELHWDELNNIPGASQRNALENFISYARGNAAATARYAQKQMYRKADAAFGTSQAILGSPRTRKWLEDYQKFTLYGPDSHITARNIGLLKYAFYMTQLAVNVSSPIINATGLATIVPQELTRRARALGVYDNLISTKLLGAAITDIGANAKYFIRGRRNPLPSLEGSSFKDYQKHLLQRASIEGHTGQTLATEFSPEIAEVTIGQGRWSAATDQPWWKSGLAKVDFYGTYLFAKSEEIVRNATILAGFDLEMKASPALRREIESGIKGGPEFEKAYQRVIGLNTNTNIDYNPWNRPMGAQKFSGLFSPLFTFRSFMLNYLHTAALHIGAAAEHAKVNAEGNREYKEFFKDLKPVAQMLFGVWLFGGMQALPGADQIEEGVAHDDVPLPGSVNLPFNLLAPFPGGAGVRPSQAADIWLSEALGQPGHVLAEVMSKGLPGMMGAMGFDNFPVLTNALRIETPMTVSDVIGMTGTFWEQNTDWAKSLAAKLRLTAKNPKLYDPFTSESREWFDLLVTQAPFMPRGVRKAAGAIQQGISGTPEMTKGGSIRTDANGQPIHPDLGELIMTGLALNSYERNQRIEERTLRYDINRWKDNVRQPLIDEYQRAYAKHDVRKLRALTQDMIPDYNRYLRTMAEKLKIRSLQGMGITAQSLRSARNPSKAPKDEREVQREVGRLRYGE